MALECKPSGLPELKRRGKLKNGQADNKSYPGDGSSYLYPVSGDCFSGFEESIRD